MLEKGHSSDNPTRALRKPERAPAPAGRGHRSPPGANQVLRRHSRRVAHPAVQTRPRRQRICPAGRGYSRGLPAAQTPAVLPAWADEHSATLHALQVDHVLRAKAMARPACKPCPRWRARPGRRSRGWNCRWMRTTRRRSSCTSNMAGSTAAKPTRAGSVMSGGWVWFSEGY